MQLKDLVSVGPATLKDFEVLGIKTVRQLAKQDPHTLYRKLCQKTGARHDPCVEDVFAAAIAQAKDPLLPHDQKTWSYWSRIRKSRIQRCHWVPKGNTLYEKYHDEEWGKPVHDDRVLFEFLILEGAQAGLSWETILKRREGYRKAFANFDWEKIALFGPKEIEKLVHNPEIIRHRGKIEGAIDIARAFIQLRKEFTSFDNYLWNFAPRSSKALSKDLQKRHFRFVGPTIIYAFMQAIGLVNDHEPSCFLRKKFS